MSKDGEQTSGDSRPKVGQRVSKRQRKKKKKLVERGGARTGPGLVDTKRGCPRGTRNHDELEKEVGRPDRHLRTRSHNVSWIRLKRETKRKSRKKSGHGLCSVLTEAYRGKPSPGGGSRSHLQRGVSGGSWILL